MEPLEITHAHDRFFCESMQRKDIAHGVLSLYLNSLIAQTADIKTLEILKDDWIDEKLKEHRADIVYRANMRGSKDLIYFLFEHKSYRDQNSSRQILRYMNQIWDQFENEKPGNSDRKLPPIISIIFYHGKLPWNIANSIKPSFAITSEIMKYIPDFEVFVIDLSVTDISSSIKQVELRTFLLALKYSRSKHVFDTVSEIIELFNSKVDQQYLKTALFYIGAVIKSEKMDRFLSLISETHKDGVSFMKTVADELREQGRKIERERSQRIETKLRKEIQNEHNNLLTIVKLLQRNVSIESIHESTNIPVNKIIEVKRELEE